MLRRHAAGRHLLDFFLRAEEGEAAAPWVRERAREVGEPVGMEYAESFKAFRFVDDDEG